MDETSNAWSPSFVEMWRVPATLLEVNDDEPLRKYVTAELPDPLGFPRRVDELYSKVILEPFRTLSE